MFGANEIVGKRYFKDADAQQMFVTSMFMTLQGEGPYRGEPAFFIRLAKCNLACSFCDTFFDDGDWLTFDQIEQRVEETIDQFYAGKGRARPEWTYHDPISKQNQKLLDNLDLLPVGTTFTNIFKDDVVAPENKIGMKTDIDDAARWQIIKRKKMVLVMTGGEPMLQDNIGPFLERMSQIFEKTQIESNGTQNTAIPASTTLVISPKCAEKKDPITGKMVATKYLTPRKEVLERADCLKFVMEATEGSPYAEVPEWAHEWKRVFNKPIFVSPMNEYNDLPQKSKQKRAESNQISIEERSTVDEVISFWEPGLLNMQENQKNHEYAAMYCVENGFILNLQIHLYASLA